MGQHRPQQRRLVAGQYLQGRQPVHARDPAVDVGAGVASQDRVHAGAIWPGGEGEPVRPQPAHDRRVHGAGGLKPAPIARATGQLPILLRAIQRQGGKAHTQPPQLGGNEVMLNRAEQRVPPAQPDSQVIGPLAHAPGEMAGKTGDLRERGPVDTGQAHHGLVHEGACR